MGSSEFMLIENQNENLKGNKEELEIVVKRVGFKVENKSSKSKNKNEKEKILLPEKLFKNETERKKDVLINNILSNYGTKIKSSSKNKINHFSKTTSAFLPKIKEKS